MGAHLKDFQGILFQGKPNTSAIISHGFHGAGGVNPRFWINPFLSELGQEFLVWFGFPWTPGRRATSAAKELDS